MLEKEFFRRDFQKQSMKLQSHTSFLTALR